MSKSKRIILCVIYTIVICAVAFSLGHIYAKYSFPEKQLIRTTKGKPQDPLYKGHEYIYTISAYRYSYFKLDENGKLVELDNSLPYRSEGIYHLNGTINSNKTAIIIMDPWVDQASEHLNEYYGEITQSKILPLVAVAHNTGHPIIVLTNDCNKVTYNCRINNQLEEMVQNREINIIYHQDMDDDQFAAYLRTQGIESIIYVGFASNMCLIGRNLGAMPMKQKGFQIFFVPEASAAVEMSNTWNNQTIHKNTTMIISQWVADIIEYDDLMDVLSTR